MSVDAKYRVVNLTGGNLSVGELLIRDGINFFERLTTKEIYTLSNTARVFIEKFCLQKQKYVPFDEAVTTIETEAEQPETESKTETTDSTDDAKKEAEAPTNTIVTPNPALPENQTPIPEDRDPKLVELLSMSNDKGSDVVKEIEDKEFLQAVIDAPDVKSGTRSAAIRRLNFLNAG